jgi:hypothetical protein
MLSHGSQPRACRFRPPIQLANDYFRAADKESTASSLQTRAASRLMWEL